MLDRHDLRRSSLQMLNSKVGAGNGANGVPFVLNNDAEDEISFG